MNEEVIYYYRTVSGGIVEIRTTNSEPSPPEGAVEITEAEYLAELAVIEAQRAADAEASRLAACAAAKQAYDLLISIGMTPEAARSVSRYSPEACAQ